MQLSGYLDVVAALFSALPWITSFRALDFHFKVPRGVPPDPSDEPFDMKHVFNAFATVAGVLVYCSYVFLPPSSSRLLFGWIWPAALALILGGTFFYVFLRFESSVRTKRWLWPVVTNFFLWVALFGLVSSSFGFFSVASTSVIVRGSVSNSDNHAINGAGVVVSFDGENPAFTRTSEEGTFVIAVPKNRKPTNLEVEASGYQSMSESLSGGVREYYEFKLGRERTPK